MAVLGSNQRPPACRFGAAVRVSSLVFAQAAWLSGIHPATERSSARERTLILAILATPELVMAAQVPRDARETADLRPGSPTDWLLLIVRKDGAVRDVGQCRGHVVGVDGRSERSQHVRQALDLTAVEEGGPLLHVCEAQAQRCVEPLVGGVVVGDLRGVP